MTVYRWKPGGERKGGDIQKIGATLSRLVEKNNERLTAPMVVAAARPEASPLHQLFEWDNEVAAERYREHQARDVINSIEVVIKGEAEPRRMFVSVVEDIGGVSQRAYATTTRVMQSPALTAQVLERAMDDMEAFRNRYAKYEALAKIADSAQSAINTLMADRESASPAA